VRNDAPADRRKQVIDFFDWGYAKGDAKVSALGYAPVTEPVKALVRKSWKTAP
jgi:phosphate transport system substrate-binding protein